MPDMSGVWNRFSLLEHLRSWISETIRGGRCLSCRIVAKLRVLFFPAWVSSLPLQSYPSLTRTKHLTLISKANSMQNLFVSASALPCYESLPPRSGHHAHLLCETPQQALMGYFSRRFLGNFLVWSFPRAGAIQIDSAIMICSGPVWDGWMPLSGS